MMHQRAGRRDQRQPGADGLQVRVRRTDANARERFEVRRFPAMTVLDVLLTIQREHDPSLAFRFSCRVAMCGTCTVRLDGRSVLACQSVVPERSSAIHVGPLAGLPVIRDLVVDMQPFWEQWERVTPYVEPAADLVEPATVRPESAEREAIDDALDCIQCGACYSSCAVAGADRTFLGPAALTRVMVLVNDSRDVAGPDRLELAAGEDGVDRCHFIYGCSNVCPKGLDPARAIRRLRTGRVTDR